MLKSTRLTRICLISGLSLTLFGCGRRQSREEGAVATATPAALPEPSGPRPSASAARAVIDAAQSVAGGRRNLRPVGVPHAVEPGMGLGPIMFGATVATIERHMRMKCDVLTEAKCLVIPAGVEFRLKGGVLTEILVHRFDRPVEGEAGKLWGVFAGGIPPNVLMAMVPEAVVESLGKPKRTEMITEKNPYNTVRRDSYPGMELDYDLNPANKKLMLGQIRILKKG